MARKYQLKRRAEKQEETRQRIVEAVVELHGTVGPGQTTISAIAEKAGVQRLTVYRHFPDEDALYRACTTHWAAENPLPDPAAWQAIADPAERLRQALTELYAYYERTAPMQENAARDAAMIPALVRAREPFLVAFGRIHQILVVGWDVAAERQPLVHAALAHALSFTTWRSLVREQGLTNDQAAGLMVCLVDCAAGQP